ncbi:hypothetical protein [Egbenema bharatensis]|uniref:hypothetical protein n=1 Tax=Egbenema bharatensis TaxID=3463334 RepID=UPI003A848DC9
MLQFTLFSLPPEGSHTHTPRHSSPTLQTTSTFREQSSVLSPTGLTPTLREQSSVLSPQSSVLRA